MVLCHFFLASLHELSKNSVNVGSFITERRYYMRHYEVVFMVHPDQSEQVPAMIERYKKIIEGRGGKVHRLENWGRRQLAYQIEKVHKAHYILMNIECDQPTLDELENAFRFNDAILRNLVIRRNKAITEPSPFSKEAEKSRPVTPKVREEVLVEDTSPEAEEAVEAFEEHLESEAELDSVEEETSIEKEGE